MTDARKCDQQGANMLEARADMEDAAASNWPLLRCNRSGSRRAELVVWLGVGVPACSLHFLNAPVLDK